MTSMASQVIDLFASGDRTRIECVMFGAVAGSVSGGIAAGLAFAPANAFPGPGSAFNAAAAGVGAVVGGLAGTKLSLKACGAQSTEGSLQRLFSQGKAPTDLVDRFESSLIAEHDISSDDARLLTKAALVNHFENGPPDQALICASPYERRQAVSVLLDKLRDSPEEA